MYNVFQGTKGQIEFRHDNGEISQVKIELAGMGTRRIRIANLPREVPDCVIRTTLTKYGEIKEITKEMWLSVYRYPVANGIRMVVVALTQHIPSHMSLAGHRVLISYEGQLLTCYECNEAEHQYQACPNRRKAGCTNTHTATTS
jgi:hypothetical protein